MSEKPGKDGFPGSSSNQPDTDNHCSNADCSCDMDRRDFVKVAGIGAASLFQLNSSSDLASAALPPSPHHPIPSIILQDASWPVLRYYTGGNLARIAMPLGGIGTGTVSLGGRGDLRDWEIMNRPAKGFIPSGGKTSPFFALYAKFPGKVAVCRILEGPLEPFEFEGGSVLQCPTTTFLAFANLLLPRPTPLAASF